MKLSQLTTEELAQVLCKLTPPLCRMARDPQLLAAFNRLAPSTLDSQPALASAARIWEEVLPLLLTSHLDDCCAVLATLTGKSADALRSQNGLTTLIDLRSVWDSDLRSFFISAGSAAQAKS